MTQFTPRLLCYFEYRVASYILQPYGVLKSLVINRRVFYEYSDCHNKRPLSDQNIPFFESFLPLENVDLVWSK